MWVSLALVVLATAVYAENLPVCIIGAGVAGLKAGGDLEAAKIPYIIVEGNNRIGGRVYPVKFEDGYLHYGATYINGDLNPIYDIAKKHNLVDLKTSEEADENLPVYTEDCVIDDCDVREFSAFTEALTEKYREFSKNGRATESFSEAFDKNYRDFLGKKGRESRKHRFDQLARMYVTDMESEWAALMSKYALLNYEKHMQHSEEDPTEFTLNKMGYKKILDVIASPIPKKRFRFNSTVSEINYSDGNVVQLTTSSGKIKCSGAIVTVSLGHLKKHHEKLFVPSLPLKKKAVINALGFGDMQKLYFVYEKEWLDKLAYRTVGKATSTIFGRGLGFDVTPWSRKAVQFWFSGPAVPAIGKMTDEQLMKTVTEHLKTTLRDVIVPTPLGVVRHMWYKDPLVLGSYSYITTVSAALGDANAMLSEPIYKKYGKPLIQFAGEATHSTHYQTTIGAFLSGEREAKRLIDSRRQ